MVHRDIKPQNLMLTPRGVVKILDFGLAKLASERTKTGGLTQDNVVMGTPEYLAPEQAQNTKAADIRADIYSLGCTLYCLLAGRPPFAGATAMQIILAHMQEAPPPLDSVRPEIPPDLAALVARMLAKDPAQRPQTPKEVAEALLPFTKPGAQPAPADVTDPFAGLTVPPVTVARAAPKPAGRRRRLIPAAAAGAVLALGLGLWADGVFSTTRVKTAAGTVVVEVEPPDAEVAVDGQRITVGRAGEPGKYEIQLADNNQRLEVRKGGFVAKGQDLTLKDAGTVVAVRLEREASKAPPPPEPARDVSKPTPAPVEPARSVRENDRRVRWVHERGFFEYRQNRLWYELDRYHRREFSFTEVSRTREAIVLRREEGRGAVLVRLTDTQSDIFRNMSDRGYNYLYTGAWEPAGPKGEEPSKPPVRKPQSVSPDGFVPLFNGKDLTGWKTHPSQKGNWRVVNGVLTGSGPAASHLYTVRDDYKDFHLRVEARINDGGNSGVYFRTQFGPHHPANNPRWLLGYNAKIHGPRLGGLIIDDGRSADVIRSHEPVVPPADQWLTLEVIAEGNHITLKVDGQTTADYIDAGRRFTRGHIALQQHTPRTVVEFRKIENMELPTK
jgi:hypothetical protein